jgi:uncharacterized protein (TIGR03435 family)
MGTSAPRRARLATTIVPLLLALPIIAQPPAATTPQPVLPTYDAVSIHPHNASDHNAGLSFHPDSFTANNITLKELLGYAYQVREDLIFGLPGWADSSHFDISARVSDPDHSVLDKLTRDQMKAMIRPVLFDRFQLKVHTDIRTLPVYDLVLAKGGPKLQKSPPPPDDPDHPTSPGKHRKTSWRFGNGDLTVTAITMSDFAVTLADILQRTVIDKTGLTDDYEFNLKWTPEEDADKAADNGAADRPPDIFTALQEQLGLKLEPAKGPITALVVDHAEQPSPN